MKHLLSILIFFSFMSVASAEAYLCKVDNSSGLNFDWEKREYYKTHFINSEYLIKVVDDTKCHEIIVGKDKYYTKKLDRTANIDGSEYRCLNHSIFGEGGNSTNNNICYYSASNTSYHCESYTSYEYSFHTKGGFYLSSNTPFDVAPVSVEKAKIEVRSPRDSIAVESGKCSRID